MGKVLEFLGLTVAVVGEDASEAEARDAFAADVTYTTAQQLAWTYLRDNTAPDEDRVVRRPARAGADAPRALPRVGHGRVCCGFGAKRARGCLRRAYGHAPCVHLTAARASMCAAASAAAPRPQALQRPFHYAVVDEVDLLLIDDCRNPLILSRSNEQEDVERFVLAKARAARPRCSAARGACMAV